MGGLQGVISIFSDHGCMPDGGAHHPQTMIRHRRADEHLSGFALGAGKVYPRMGFAVARIDKSKISFHPIHHPGIGAEDFQSIKKDGRKFPTLGVEYLASDGALKCALFLRPPIDIFDNLTDQGWEPREWHRLMR